MTTIAVPAADETPWPTLGPQVCDWMERHLCHGPGDLLGDPIDYRRDEELRGLIWSWYEIFPRGHEREGRRRFNRAALFLAKGLRKSDALSRVVAAELAPNAPVRFRQWNGDVPDGQGVRDPYIAMLANTVKQTEDTAYDALKAMLERSPIRGEFDIGAERIMRKDGRGKALPLAAKASSRDGQKATFLAFDETHHFISEGLRCAHKYALAGMTKRALADAWALETSTVFAPGAGSVAEATFEHGRAIADGRKKEPSMFFFYRGANPSFTAETLRDPANAKAAVLEAYGPCADWTDIDGKVRQFGEPDADVALLQRLILNQIVRPTLRAFDVALWASRHRPGATIPAGAQVTLGFNGSARRDATALIATDMASGLQEPALILERPMNAPEFITVPGLGTAGGVVPWEISRADVDTALRLAMERWRVVKMYADPTQWDETVASWSGEFEDEDGKPIVVAYDATHVTQKFVFAVRSFCDALTSADGGLTHGGTPELAAAYARHIGNAHRHLVPTRGEDDAQLWYPEKESSDSPAKINAARAGILSWQCRLDAIEDGLGRVTEEWDGEVMWLE